MNLSFFVFIISFRVIFSLKCSVQFKRAKICKIFKYNEDCIQGKLQFCELLAIKKNQNKCPFYVCDPILFQNTSSSLTSEKVQAKNNFSLITQLISKQNQTATKDFEPDKDSKKSEFVSNVLVTNTSKSGNITNVLFNNSLNVNATQLFETTLKNGINTVLKKNITNEVLNNSLLLRNNSQFLHKDTLKSENLSYSHSNLLTNNANISNGLLNDSFRAITDSQILYNKTLKSAKSTDTFSEISNVNLNSSEFQNLDTLNSEKSSIELIDSNLNNVNISFVLLNDSLSVDTDSQFQNNDTLISESLSHENFTNEIDILKSFENVTLPKRQNKKFLNDTFQRDLKKSKKSSVSLSNSLSNASISTENIRINVPQSSLNSTKNSSNSFKHFSESEAKNNFENVFDFKNKLFKLTSNLSDVSLNDKKNNNIGEDKSNWKKLDTIKTFSKNQSNEKFRLLNDFHQNLKSQQDKLNWKQLDVNKDFVKSEKLEKSRLQTHFQQTIKNSRSTAFFFQKILPKIFSKMPIDCGEKVCSLEFHQRSDVRKLKESINNLTNACFCLAIELIFSLLRNKTQKTNMYKYLFFN